MSVTVIFNSYSDFCGAFMYGKEINELSTKARECLDEVLDGSEIDLTSGSNLDPDNLVVNYLTYFDDKDAAECLLTDDEIAAKVEDGTLKEWMDEHEEEVREAYEEEHKLTVLDRQYGGNWVALL